MNNRPEMSDLFARLLAAGMMKDLDEKKKKFDGTASSVTDAMRKMCPLTKSVSRQCEFEYETREEFEDHAAAIFGAHVKAEVSILRDSLLGIRSTLHFHDGTPLWLNCVTARVDAPAYSMTKYALLEAEDAHVEKFIKQTVPLFCSAEWHAQLKVCKRIVVEQFLDKVTAYAKIGGGRPTIRIARPTVAEAVNALLREVTIMEELDSRAVNASKAARAHIDAFVAKWETERRAAAAPTQTKDEKMEEVE